MVFFTIKTATFLISIRGVVSMSAEEKMIRVYTGRNITTMTDNQSIGDGSVMEFPRIAMCAGATTLKVKTTITKVERCTSPKPTSFGLVNAFPKAFLGVNFKGLGKALVAAKLGISFPTRIVPTYKRVVAGLAKLLSFWVRSGIMGAHTNVLSCVTPPAVRAARGLFVLKIRLIIPHLSSNCFEVC
jgi:hypothetical protein